jgi:hypothetical protein
VDPTYIGEETNHAGLFAPARTTVVSSRERTFEASRCIVTYPKAKIQRVPSGWDQYPDTIEKLVDSLRQADFFAERFQPRIVF